MGSSRTRGRRRSVALLLGVMAVTAAFVPSLTGRPIGAASTVPNFDHIFVIVMENHSYDDVIGNPSAPYLNALAANGALLTNYYAVGHQSLSNYLALTGGSTFGVTSDCSVSNCDQGATPNIAVDRVEPSGRTWKAYMESMPGPCSTNDSGEYAQRHNPFVYYSDIRNTSECNKDVPYSQLSTDLQSAATTPNFAWITPNLIDDMHDGSVAQGDSWLAANVPAILASPAFTQQHSLLAITFDEDDSKQSGCPTLGATTPPCNQVPTILTGYGIAPGTRSNVQYTHYSLLKTIETAWSLGPLTSNDANAQPISDIFPPPPPTTTVPVTAPPPPPPPTVPTTSHRPSSVPAAPVAVRAVSNATTKRTGSLRVTYTAGKNHNSVITRFTVTCASRDGGGKRRAVRLGAKAAPVTVIGVATKKTYSCTVKATNARGVGPASSPSKPVIVGAPAAPTGAHPVRVSSGKVKVNFSPGRNNGSKITRYTATCQSSNRGRTRVHVGARSPIVVGGLTPHRTYTCSVKATNARGTSVRSRASAPIAA